MGQTMSERDRPRKSMLRTLSPLHSAARESTDIMTLVTSPDPVLAAAGEEGERVVARMRLGLCVLLVMVPTYELLAGPPAATYRWSFLLSIGAVCVALALFAALRLGGYRPWIAFASSALDVSLVTATLTGYMLIGPPSGALDSRTTFEVYFLAIAATSLRYDQRVCLVAGALALAQYALLAFAAASRGVAVHPAEQAGRSIVLAGATVLAVALVRRAQRLRQLSTHDRLTGLCNRAYFDSRAEPETERARRYGHPLAIALLDIDHFKKFNDSFGHQTGDDVLRTVATTLSRRGRTSDLIARYGGEEFAVLLPETSRAGATDLLETLRAAVAAAPITLPAGNGPRALTISAGIAVFPDDGEDLESLLASADARLYAAKQAGRDRVVSE
jgi:diguanylate cyclase (GGDEF)-like protein